MAKFFGKIGYVKTEETRPGISEPVIVEKAYSGELNRFTRKYQNSTKVNTDINLSVEISIIADSYLLNNMHYIRYVKMNGAAWEVLSITPEQPRLLLDIGGLYNGPVA